jgi:tetratricopeptide (TPR) repeat protein
VVNQPFRNFGAVLVLLALVSPVFAQQKARSAAQTRIKATTSKKPTPKPEPTATPHPAVEKERFDTAIATVNPTEKAELLVKFIADFPSSEYKTRAQESLAGARAAIADERLSAGDLPGAMRLFKVVVEEAPKPYNDRLYNGIIATIPGNLWVRGHRAEGVEIARLVEARIGSDATKLLLLSTFYLGSENGDGAKRIAEAALELDEKNATAHQTLASAHRLNFDLESAAASFAKAVELDPDSTIAKRSLADMKRAIGKANEAEAVYRDILAVNDKDNQARTGLVLALFDQGKRVEAEAEMANALVETPGNVVLLAGAAYSYAASKDGDKAVELARRAIEKEPRYIWSHIALGRGLLLQGKPVEAEQVLLNARKYGNFPTLQYEIASARLAAGFFREAVEELKKSFEVADGAVKTRLGGRIEATAESFMAAIANERRASTFAPVPADSPDDTARLKALVELNDAIANETKDVSTIVNAAEAFASGSDNMAVHRKLYAANLLLQAEVAPDEAMKLSSEAIAGLDKSLDVPNAGAAVMASELYEARNVSFSRDDFLLIPEVPRQTLTALMRGRVEETTGLALLKQGKPEEASVRFRRALTVLPKDSAWWRSATWNLGTSLAAEGKDKEALESMISSYVIDKPNVTRYILIEQLWLKINGSRDGLEQKVGPNPLPDFTASVKVQPTPEASQPDTITPSEATKVEQEPIPSPQPQAGSEPTPTPEVKTETSAPTPEPSPSPVQTDPTPTPTPEVSPTPVESSTPILEEPLVKPTPISEISVSPSPVVSPTPAEEKTSEPSPIPIEKSVAKSSPPPANKPLFDPIIISIPKRSSERAKPIDEKELEATNSPNNAKESDPEAVQKEMSPSSDPARPRIVEGKAITGELLPCEIGVSQESVSIINNGGSIGMLVSIEQGEDIKLVTAESNSITDIEVLREPDITEISSRAMFVIKSITEKTGLYQVTFKAPCGKKVVTVRVR